MKLSREDRWLTWWLSACFAVAAALIAANALGPRYVGVSYLPRLFSPLPFAAAMGAWKRFGHRSCAPLPQDRQGGGSLRGRGRLGCRK